MSLAKPASLGNLWNINEATLDIDLNTDYYLQTELGVALRALQDENSILAIKDPKDFIDKRTAHIKNLFKKTDGTNGPVTQAFKTRYDELKKIHVPEETARKLAKQTAVRVFNEELELLELQAPDAYTKAFGIASVEHNATIATNQVAGGLGADDQFDMIAKYKSYKRAKKAAKKSEK